MELKNLFDLLSEQEKNLTQLLNVVVKKQRAIIENNYQALDDSVFQEETILTQIVNVEKKRIELTSKMVQKYQLKAESLKLSHFLDSISKYIPTEMYDEFQELKLSIREKSEKVNKTNEQNMALIEHSREFIKQTLAILTNGSKKQILNVKM
ncbi:MAG: hypothetical protein C0425_02045 [Chlorobiaceae bacterium]|nr:hypothetical protein [Chlorobiaceae bacterium]MBA4309100.1 hypothetical protein [Chlorobiaceae bacterium]